MAVIFLVLYAIYLVAALVGCGVVGCVVMNIFQIPTEPGFMEKSVQDYTHAHWPQERFDQVVVAGRYAFGRAGDTYGALIAHNELH